MFNTIVVLAETVAANSRTGSVQGQFESESTKASRSQTHHILALDMKYTQLYCWTNVQSLIVPINLMTLLYLVLPVVVNLPHVQPQ